MKITGEVVVNPGENALFVTEMRIERGEDCWQDGWWGLWVSFWLYPRRKWREWFWSFECDTRNRMSRFQVMLCGFEITWQQVKSFR